MAIRTSWVAGAVALLGMVLMASGCGWRRFAYSGFGRDAWQKPTEVIASLALAPGARVADLGAGGGYFTWKLADAVGKDGRVYAVDVDTGMLEFIREESDTNGYGQVETVLAAFEDPGLPEPVDLIFSCNTYHHLEDRVAYFRNAARYLRPGGRIAIIEHSPDASWFARWFGHNTDPDQIREELEAAGYTLADQPGFLERQSFLIFRRAG